MTVSSASGVTMPPTSVMRQSVGKLITDQAAADGAASPDELLGRLDSIRLVELVVALEARFGVAMTADVITAETFSSVDGIVAAVAGCAAQEYVVDGRPVVPPHNTVVDDLVHRAETGPDAPFVTWLPAAGGAQVLTYGEFEARSRALAAALSEPDDLVGRRVGLLAGNDVDTLLAVFALLRAGATCLFLNPLDPPERLRSILAGHKVSTVLRTPLAATGHEDLATLVDADPAPAGPDWTDRHLSGAAPAFMFGTSGTTAASKLVVQSHRAVLSNAEALRRHHRLDAGSKIMCGLPLHHANAVNFTATVVHAGAHMVMPQQINALRYRAQLDEHRPTIASVVPTVLEAVLATGRGWRPPRSLRYFVTAAAPLTTSLAKRVTSAFGVRVVQGYGLTETTNFSTKLPIDLSDEDYAAVMLDSPIPTVGVAVDGNEVTVLSRTGEPVGEGEIGELCMRGHNVMAGYADRPDLTAVAFEGGWFHSGDLGYWTVGRDGRRYFYLTGRIKNMAKVSGEAVSLDELERALRHLEGVADAGCVAVPHPVLGEEIVAAVCLRSATVEDVTQRLAPLMSPVAMPRRWFEVPAIPRTPTGKLQRPVLLELLGLKGDDDR
ncbi:AMP-binding protein [Dactylosporangium sp. NPDC051541]|uniref:AMP-binding protein n=1 Tax=Dactylosporangium sp. NPDC051541 TaxID=3363977 RepID=UPI0037AC3635